VTGNYWAGTVSVLRNAGDGAYSRGTDIDLGVPVNFVLPADLDGDGAEDLVVTAKGKRAYILRNLGDAAFAAPDPIETLTNPNVVVCADLNDDQALDLVVGYWPDSSSVGEEQASLSVFYNRSDATFDSAVHHDIGARPWGIVAVDLDGDHHLDLAVVHGFSSALTVLLNEGDGTLAEHPKTFNVRSAIQSVAAGDLDGDGRADLAVAGGDAYVAVLRGKGDGTLEAPIEYPGAESPSWVTVADVDGDEDLDVLAAHYQSSALSVFLNDGAGTLAEHRTVSLWSWSKLSPK
jgi:hypothetical protein